MKLTEKKSPIKPFYWILMSIIVIIGNIIIVNYEQDWGVWIWLGLFVIFLAIETATMDLTTIWFAIGSLTSYIISLLGLGFMPQLVVFNLLSLSLLICARPAAVRKINSDIVKTNVDAIIGEEVLVTEEINFRKGTGVVFVNGIEWTARSLHKEEVLPADILVKIEAIEGVKVIVTKC